MQPFIPYVDIIIIMVILSAISPEHIALSYIEKLCEHRIRENQQIKSTVHDAKSYLK